MSVTRGTLQTLALVAAAVVLAPASAWAQAASDVDCAGCVNTPDIADGAVTGNKLAQGSILTGKYADGSVTGNKLGNGSILTGKYADQSVTGNKIAQGAILAGKLANGAVRTGKIFDGAVTNAKLAANAVDTGQIVDGAVTNAKLAASVSLSQGRTEIEDCGTITEPGSYVLTGDLPGLSRLNADGGCLVIAADEVTLDLGGFSIIGRGTGTGAGIFLDGRINVEIRNGTVSGFGGDGIRENSALGRELRMFDLRVTDNEGHGIFTVGGAGHQVVNCLVRQNGGGGIILDTSNAVIVRDNIAVGNAGDDGIRVFAFAIVTGNVATANNGNGIASNNNATVTGNSANINGAFGISVGFGATVTGNTANENGSIGIVALSGSTVTGNTAIDNGSDGISTLGGSTVTGNTASFNGGTGIAIGSGSTVTGNTANTNNGGGIFLGGNNLVDGNTATGNTGSNIGACSTCTIGLNHAP